MKTLLAGHQLRKFKEVLNFTHAFKVDGIHHYCRYYADIRQTISASDQEMNSALAELSRVSTDTPHTPQSGQIQATDVD